METTLATPKLVHGKDAFLASLFSPGGTADGWFEVKRGQILVHFRSENYALNRENVFCYATKMEDGRTWYSYGGELNRMGCVATENLAISIRNQLAYC